MKEFLARYFNELVPIGFRFKVGLIFLGLRISTIFIIFSLYNNILEFIPSIIILQSQISLIIALVILIVFLLPFQEWLETNLKKRFLSEYLFDDPLSLKLAQKRFELKVLIRTVFPDMVKIAGVNYGRLVILKKNKAFEAYTYSEGRPRKIKNQTFQVSDELIQFLKARKQQITIADAEKRPWLNQELLKLKAEFILPFMYREKIFGFLALSSMPAHDSLSNLKLLSSKSAIAVHNNILSSQVANFNVYKNEVDTANKIQGMVFNTKVPKNHQIDFQLIKKDPNILLEFMPNEGGEVILIAIALSTNNFGGVLVLSHILGKLYSLTLLKKSHNHKSIRSFVEQSFEALNWKDGYEMVVGILNEISNKISFIQVGTQFKITNENEEGNLISVGWRYTLDLSLGPYYLVHKKDRLLRIKNNTI